MAGKAVLPKYDYIVELSISERSIAKQPICYVLPKKESGSITIDTSAFKGAVYMGFKLRVIRTVDKESEVNGKKVIEKEIEPTVSISVGGGSEKFNGVEAGLHEFFASKKDGKLSGKTHKVVFGSTEIGSIRTRVVTDDSSTTYGKNILRVIFESRIRLNKDQRKQQRKAKQARIARRKAFLKKRVAVPPSATSSAPATATATSVPAPTAAVAESKPIASKDPAPKVDKKKKTKSTKSKKTKKTKKGPVASVEAPNVQLKAF